MWTLLNNHDDWNKHRHAVADQKGLSPYAIQWSSGPVEFPCLVSTLVVPQPLSEVKAISAFVYAADVKQFPGIAQDNPAETKSPVAPPSQDQFNRWVAAQVLTVVKYLVDTGICKQEAFEESLLESLELVDQRNGNSKLTQSQRALIASARPKG